MKDWDEKNRDTSFGFFAKGIKTLWELIGVGKEKNRFKRIFFWLVIIQILNLIFPFILKLIFDELPNVLETKTINYYLIFLMVLFFLSKNLTVIINRLKKEVELLRGLIKLENFWPAMAQKKLLDLSQSYHEKENTGKKIAKIEKGCNRMLEILMNLVWDFVPQTLFITINIVFMLIIDWKLGILFFIPFIPAIWVNLRCYKKFAPMWDKWEENKEISNGLFCQSLINSSTVQGYVQEKREVNRFSKIRKKMDKLDVAASIGSQKYLLIVGLLLNNFFILTVLIGIYFVITGQSTVGTIIYIIATGNTTNESIWQITRAYTQIIKYLFSVMRMKDLLDEKVDVKNNPNAIVPKRYEGNFEVQNVTFSYNGNDTTVLRNVSLDIPKNKMAALVSKTGGGKTTLIKLLCRVYDLKEGQITLDGVDIRKIDRSWYRKLFAVVQQDIDIFDGTIAENIKYGFPEATDDQITESIRAAHLEDEINDSEKFPDGIDTEVGERGVKLSGGQRQRVGIARAYLSLLNGVKVLVLDEATSSLDSEAEKIVQEMIDKLKQKTSISIIAIAHRLATIKQADIIYIMDKGKIIDRGTHQDLMSNKKGLYSRLVELQNLD